MSTDTMRREERLRGLDAELRADIPALRALQFRIGRRLLEISRLGEFTTLGTTTFPMYCEQRGLSVLEGREYLGMVQAADVQPEVEAKVLEAKLSPQKATLVHEFQKRPDLLESGEDAIALAEGRCGRELREEVFRRKEEVRVLEPPVTRTFFFSAQENREVDRSWELVKRLEAREVSDSEAMARVCAAFNEAHDPERVALRMKEKDEKAKASPTERPSPSRALTVEDLERSRHIAALTRREILRVVGDRCWVRNCPNRVYLECCHRRPFRAGGANALWNLLRLCHDHHGGLDLGEWWPLRRSDGAWIQMSRAGKRVGFLREAVWRFLDRFEPGLAAQGRAPP